jgi:hypothetical protein
MKRLPDGRLAPGDSCTSDWMGHSSDRPPKVIGGEREAVGEEAASRCREPGALTPVRRASGNGRGG